MLPWLAVAASAAAPTVIDLLTGASKKKRSAYDAIGLELDDQLTDLDEEMGASVTESASFKSGTELLDKSVKKNLERVEANAAAGGLTDEAKLGALNDVNEGYSGSVLQLLSKAEQDREALEAQRRALKLKKLGFNLDRATATKDAQDKLVGGLSSIGMQFGMKGLLSPTNGMTDILGQEVLPDTTSQLFG